MRVMNDLDPKLQRFTEQALTEIPVPPLQTAGSARRGTSTAIGAIAATMVLVVVAVGVSRLLIDARRTAGSAPTTTPVATGSCPRTQSVDSSGVATRNGLFGIAGDTLLPLDEDVTFGLLRRGTTLGEAVTVRFEQLSTSAPASWVEYRVQASAQQNAWGTAAFQLAVKPIAFPNSCWRLLVNGTDTGLVIGIAER